MALELGGSRYDESMPVVSAGDLLLINAHTKRKMMYALLTRASTIVRLCDFPI
jgi:hypothetical protein